MGKMFVIVILMLLASCVHVKSSDPNEYFVNEHSQLHFQIFMQNRELIDVKLHIEELIHQLSYVTIEKRRNLVQEELVERRARKKQIEDEIKFKTELMLYLEKEFGVACLQCK